MYLHPQLFISSLNNNTMAKLSAHGNEIARFERAYTDNTGTQHKVRISVRSDHHILRNAGFLEHNRWTEKSSMHWFGWKLWKKVKVGRIDAVIQHIENGDFWTRQEMRKNLTFQTPIQ